MSAILDWFDQINDDRDAAGDPNDTSPRANSVRAACDWTASKGAIASAPWVQATCRDYWDDNPDYDVPTGPMPPFEGGQCAAQYRMGVQYINCNTGVQAGASQTVAVNGPITSVEVTDPTPGSGCGEVQDVILSGPNGSGSSTFALIEPGTFQLTGLFRVDGMPDDCGDPDPEPIPPIDVPGAPEDGEPFDVSPPGWTGPPITITFEPGDGDPEYGPVNTPFGPGDIFGPPNQPPESGPGSEPLPPSEGDDVAGGDPSGDEESAPESGVIIGYSWAFPNIPMNRGGVAGKSPRTFFEALGTIQLKLQDPDGGRYYDSQYVIRESRGAVFRKDETVSVVGVSWAVKPSFGVVQIRPLVVEEQ